MPQEIIFDIEARDALKIGVDKLANAVKVTLGPKGRTVVIKKEDSIHLTKDGVTVAQAVNLKDPIEDMGAQMLKEVSANAADLAGDGTTTATVLAQAMIHAGMKNVAAGANPMDVKRGMDITKHAVITTLKSNAISIDGDLEKIQQVATISANNDAEIGGLIAHAIEKVKKEGVITVEEASGTETSIKVVEGMQFDQGYLSPFFATDQDKKTVEYENPYILLHEGKITSMSEVLPLLESVAPTGKALVIVADDVEGEALNSLVMNKLKVGLKVAAVKSPSFGRARIDLMNDLAVILGTSVVSDREGMKLSEMTLEHLGSTKKIVIDQDRTILVDGAGEEQGISKRVEHLKVMVETADNKMDKERFQSRLAKFLGGVAVLYIGAVTELEMKEKKDRVDDALAATKAALEEGIVPGGGQALFQCKNVFKDLDQYDYNEDEMTGMHIVLNALSAPMKQIAENAGKSGDVIVDYVENNSMNWGYNAKIDSYQDLLEAGIIDPVKVTRVALENAVSIAGMIITTECVIP